MKKIVFILIAILLLVAVPVTVFFIGKNQELRSKAAPATRLTFSPSSVTKTAGEQFSLNIDIDTGENNVAVAQLHITYDATKLEALSITNGPKAPNIVASGTVGNGTATISVAATSTTNPIQGIGTIAILRFKGITQTTTPSLVKFDTTTFVSGIGEQNPNVLTSTGQASVTISGGASQQSSTIPTPTPTLNLSPTPTLPTVTPTLNLTPTPTTSLEDDTGEATGSALTIDIEKDKNDLSPQQPVISGVAPPGSTLTIVIQSDPITAVVTADENGNWRYIPDSALESGDHSITVTVQAPDGSTYSESDAFTVIAGGIGGGAEDGMPVSGSTTPTLLLLIAAVISMFFGNILRRIAQ